MSIAHRRLSADESRILELLLEHYGPANTADRVFFTEEDEAVIMVRDRTDSDCLCVNLTVLPLMQQAEQIPDDEVFARYLSFPET